MSQFFASGGPSIGASASVLPITVMSFRIDWFDLPAIQGTVEGLLQHHNSKASVLRCSAFFMVQLSYPYMTTGKTIVLTRCTSVSKVMSLLFNILSKIVTAFLPRSKHLFISWLQSPSAMILEPKKIKSVTVSTFSPSICQKVMGLDAMIFILWMLSFKPAFSLSSFTLKRLFSSSSLSAIRVIYHLHKYRKTAFNILVRLLHFILPLPPFCHPLLGASRLSKKKMIMWLWYQRKAVVVCLTKSFWDTYLILLAFIWPMITNIQSSWRLIKH